MSASTKAAITAKPAATDNTSLSLDPNPKSNPRRRTVAIVEKKTTTDVLSEGGINGVSNDKMIANGNDLSHTMRGESVTERSKDLSQLKKGLITSAAVSPRRKKPSSKPEKPKWLTILSILAKNFLLLAVLLWLGQMIWKWSGRIPVHGNTPFAAFEYEGRISEVEASLKKTAKMLQVQLDVIDKKIGSEIGIVTRELSKQVEEKGALIEKELRNLETRTDNLDKSLGELKNMGFLSKEELERFWNELKNDGTLGGNDKGWNLDKIRALARDIVEKEIEKHAADGLGRVDYALASGGARVVMHSRPYGFGNGWFAAAKARRGMHPNAHKMLEPSFGEPGQCFALEGNQGFVEIKLRTAVVPQAITLEHVPKSVAYDRSSAPKDVKVWGWFQEAVEATNNIPNYHLVASFSYDLEKSSVQTFNVEASAGHLINMVRMDIESNHGSSALTCIYRLRVHGYEPSSPAATMDMQS